MRDREVLGERKYPKHHHFTTRFAGVTETRGFLSLRAAGNYSPLVSIVW